MAYEIKVVFKMIEYVIKASKTLDEALVRIAAIANAEGVVMNFTEKDS
jgi:hypothetical protein